MTLICKIERVDGAAFYNYASVTLLGHANQAEKLFLNANLLLMFWGIPSRASSRPSVYSTCKIWHVSRVWCVSTVNKFLKGSIFYGEHRLYIDGGRLPDNTWRFLKRLIEVSPWGSHYRILWHNSLFPENAKVGKEALLKVRLWGRGWMSDTEFL